MSRLYACRAPQRRRMSAMLFAAAVLLAGSGCASGDSGGGEAATDAPLTVAGYEFRAGAPDATLAAIVDAYQQQAWVRPPMEFTEDFEGGAGPFETFQDETGSVSAVDGVLRISASEPYLITESYAELRTSSDRVVVTAVVDMPTQLAVDEGALISINRQGDGAYGLTLQADSLVLLEWENMTDEPRILDSATLPAPATGQPEMALVVDARQSDPGVVGLLNGEPIVGRQGASGSYDSVSLGAVAAEAPLTINFAAAAVYALQEGAAQDIFDGQQEYVVEQNGTDIATISILEPGECLRTLPDFGDDKCVPGLLAEAAPEGMTVESQDIAGAPVTTGTQGETSFWLWMDDGVLHAVTAQDAAAGRAFVEAFITQAAAPIGS